MLQPTFAGGFALVRRESNALEMPSKPPPVLGPQSPASRPRSVETRHRGRVRTNHHGSSLPSSEAFERVPVSPGLDGPAADDGHLAARTGNGRHGSKVDVGLN